MAKRFFAALVLAVVAGGPAFAQGRSDSAPGQNKDKAGNSSSRTSQGGSGNNGRGTDSTGSAPRVENTRTLAAASGLASPTTAAAPTSAPAAAAATAFAYYGSWLDDASIVAPGDVWIGLATGYWRGQNNRQYDAPVASVAVGLTPRFQAGGSMSFYHFRDGEGFSENGFGNVSFYGKFQILDPYRAENAVGLAVTPLVEIAPGSYDRLGWALPVNVEAHRGALRLYGSAGYFSRGSVFATIGADVPLTSRLSISGNFGQSYASAGTHQTSVGAGISIGVTAMSGAYIGIGQTMMPSEVGPSGLSLAGGFSFLLPQPKQP